MATDAAGSVALVGTAMAALLDVAGALREQSGWIAFVSLLLSVTGGAWRALTGAAPRLVIGETHRTMVADLQRQLTESKDREVASFNGWMRALNVAEHVTAAPTVGRPEGAP